MKNELQSIFQGTSPVSHGTLVQTIASYLSRSQETSTLAKGTKPFKTQETKSLIAFINQNKLWNCNINFDAFVSQGAEQRVYIENEYKILKLNDSIYYETWLDYFNNLLLNNYFFPDTAYNLLGFYKSETDDLYALVEQNFVKSTHPTNTDDVKLFLAQNGFINTKNNDYYNSDLGIVLEDLHDENVLTKNNLLYFIDTVFYIDCDIFWK